MDLIIMLSDLAEPWLAPLLDTFGFWGGYTVVIGFVWLTLFGPQITIKRQASGTIFTISAASGSSPWKGA